MNSEICKGSIVSTPKYPILKRTKSPLGHELEYVVLFTSPRKGIVVHVISNPTNEESVKIGWNGSTKWDSSGGFGEEESFVPFDGAIQLSN